MAPPAERYRNQAKCVNCSPGKDRTIAQWHSSDGIVWHERPGWQPKPGRLDNQEVIFWDEDAEFRGSRGAYYLYTRAPTQNDISVQPLAIRRFLSRDPFNCTSAIHQDKLDNESCWHDGIVLGGTDPDELDDSTHPRSATTGANQSWDKWPVEFGSGQVWKVAQTFPTTYILFAEMHWLWTMTCWKHAPGCKDPSRPWQSQNGCVNLPAEEPCQPVDVRLAVSRDGVSFTRQNNTAPAGERCVGMCDPEARRALISVGMAGTWMSRSVWANPNPILSRSGQELRLFFNGRNVDNRNRIDPLGAPGFDTSPVIEGAGFAVFRPDSFFGLRAGYGSTGRGEVVTKPLFSCGRAGDGDGRWTRASSASGGVCRGTLPHGWGWAKELLLNMDSGVGGELRCELQDASGKAIPGFTLDESVPMTRNSLRARVRWAGEKPLSSLGSDQPLRLRFSMEDTWLYSFQFV